jgi:HEXXH motif-containing protein
VVVNSVTSRAARHHLLSRSDFSAMAEGRASAAFVEVLRSAQRSRRLLLLKALLDRAELNPALLSPLPGADSVWQALASAQVSEPAALDCVLLHPQVGTALSFALRRLTGGAGGDSAAGNPPLWVDVGQIHTIGLVVSARAGLNWRTSVALRHGRVMLPGLGMAEFPCPDGFDVALAKTEGGRIWLEHGGDVLEVPADPSQDARLWLGLRRAALSGPPDLTVWVDDLDPFRDFADPISPSRLDDRQLARWRRLLGAAWRIICDDQPEMARALAAGVTSLVPLPAADGWENRSASTGEAFGSVMVSPPSDATSLAVSLVHEFQHIKLGGLMHLVTLCGVDEAEVLYAPWRDDPRPLGGLVQGAYAFLGIATFWRAHRKNLTGSVAELATFEYAYAREQTREALAILRASTVLTPLGREFLDRMHDHVMSWPDDEISPGVMDLVRLVTDSHRAGWRIRHLRPGPTDASTMAGAWLDGADPPAPQASAVVPNPDRNWSQGRLGLVRRRLRTPDRSGDVPWRARWAANLTEWDVALVAGNYAAAIDGYLNTLRTDPTDLDAWTGLGLALRAAGATPASAALLGRPELVLAVDAALLAAGRAPQRVQLASWLGSVMRDPVTRDPVIRDWPRARSAG